VSARQDAERGPLVGLLAALLRNLQADLAEIFRESQVRLDLAQRKG